MMARKISEIADAKNALRARAQKVLDDLKPLSAKVEAGDELTPGEEARAKNLRTAAGRIAEEGEALDAEATEALATAPSEPGDGGAPLDLGGVHGSFPFASEFIRAGFDRRTRPHVAVPFNAATFDGDYGDAQVTRRDAPGLGADQRWLFPSLTTESVARDVTGIQAFKHKARTLADPALMIRGIAATTEKPETDTQSEVVQAALNQIATKQAGVPNIMLESSKFRSFIEVDLRLAFAGAIDRHVTTEIAAATPPEGTEGQNILEAIVHAAEKVASAGYSPRIVAAAPQDLISLLLLENPGPESSGYVGQHMNHLLAGLTKVPVKGLVQPMVIDPSALGTLYMSPVELKAFEENAGGTNSSTVRIENNGLFLVQRPDAAALAMWPEISA